MTIINVHSPTADKSVDEIEEFYSNLGEVFQKYSRDRFVFVCGDFNACVGKRRAYESCTGRHSFGEERSVNGERLVEFCELNELFACNTAFQHRDAR